MQKDDRMLNTTDEDPLGRVPAGRNRGRSNRPRPNHEERDMTTKAATYSDSACQRWRHYEGRCVEAVCELDNVTAKPDCDRDGCDGQHDQPTGDGT